MYCVTFLHYVYIHMHVCSVLTPYIYTYTHIFADFITKVYVLLEPYAETTFHTWEYLYKLTAVRPKKGTAQSFRLANLVRFNQLELVLCYIQRFRIMPYK